MQNSSILISCCILSVLRFTTADAPNIVITQGTVIGTTDVTLRGRMFFSYRGIPYAKPPIGELRFKVAEPVDPSLELIDARFDGNFCMQKNDFSGIPLVGGSEDCLNINVYTTQINNENLLPVMLFIHGGAWYAGGSGSYISGANYLLDKDVVIVTFNYRLGAMGFLSTGDSACPGNNGMKDQVAALKWVQQNIGAFGGNPNQVTLFGQSAGAASVHFHLLSNMSQGLFHKAISESGSSLSMWALPPDPLPMAQKQAEFFDCPQENTTELVECLRTVDAAALANSSDIFRFWSLSPITIFRPVVEQPWDGVSEEPFLTGTPLELIQSGRFQKIPWLTGVVAQDGILRGLPIIADPELLSELNSNWTTLGPRVFSLWDSIDDQDTVDDMWKNFTAFYFKDELPITEENGINLVDAFSDRLFIQGIHKSVLLQASKGHNSIFLYNFNYKGKYSFGPSLTTAVDPPDYGIAHSDDLIYLFSGLFPEWPESHPDLKIVDSMVTLWTNFAIFGIPTPGSGSSSQVTCDPYSTTSNNTCDLSDLAWTNVPADHTTYLNIQLNNQTNLLEFEIQDNFYQERMNFWDSSNLKENYPAS